MASRAESSDDARIGQGTWKANRREAKCLFNLPNEVLEQIFDNLETIDRPSLLDVSRTCWRFNLVATDFLFRRIRIHPAKNAVTILRLINDRPIFGKLVRAASFVGNDYPALAVLQGRRMHPMSQEAVIPEALGLLTERISPSDKQWLLKRRMPPRYAHRILLLLSRLERAYFMTWRSLELVNLAIKESPGTLLPQLKRMVICQGDMEGYPRPNGFFTAAPNLTHLEIRFRISLPLDDLPVLQHLEHLSLNECHITKNDLQRLLSCCPSLRKFAYRHSWLWPQVVPVTMDEMMICLEPLREQLVRLDLDFQHWRSQTGPLLTLGMDVPCLSMILPHNFREFTALEELCLDWQALTACRRIAKLPMFGLPAYFLEGMLPVQLKALDLHGTLPPKRHSSDERYKPEFTPHDAGGLESMCPHIELVRVNGGRQRSYVWGQPSQHELPLMYHPDQFMGEDEDFVMRGKGLYGARKEQDPDFHGDAKMKTGLVEWYESWRRKERD
ncbi:uncharacterized protein E0L32_009436 [Thyridium curvatum]|uniref:F-box domain-containing protein n=1 Tax=Thyridium curvatum TaxID=1093900 RepID=A0A507AJ53_9PEZI|nr:uncharacterized protein E0L32_009436 [Thyridium curvatum]TPX09392.1 hypothetical protein E0L32_009436 [Thyridium curvatum]